MGFVEAIRSGLNNFFNPTGRTSISGFWWYYLFIAIIAGVLGVIGGFVSGAGGREQTWVGIIFSVLAFVLCLSILFASIRRLHDSGRSGWNVLWGIIPLIGTIYLIILLCKDSQPGANQYGYPQNN